ncbi:MAG: hypothetical protein QOF83_716 [Solirubrobacteraceae bacterium]|jgi:hypothetical protein|nr:hypothetical protein [Solirubrobacteraceae bacterium]
MRRIAGFLAAVAAPLALTAGVAVAASSPTVSTGAAKSVSDSAESLSGTVNPNGNQTGYVFQYGLTTAYGLNSNSHSAGGGTKPVNAAATIRGLTPGTPYHYRIVALSKAGSSIGRDRTFRTSGHPPANVSTGAPSSVRKEQATVTGTVTPNGANTTWVVQYGLSTAYGLQTFAQSAGSGTTPVPVSALIPGLAPASLFHYRIVAYHGGVASAGADQTFFTEPIRRPKPRLSATTKPSVDRKAPYTFTTTGALRGAGFIPASSRCTGSVALRYYKGRRQVGLVVTPVGSNCGFTAQNNFRPQHIGRGVVRLRITIHYRGNGYLMPADRTNFVTAG